MNSQNTRKYFSRLSDDNLSKLAKIYLDRGKLPEQTLQEVQQYYLTTTISLDSECEAEKIKQWSDESQVPSLAVKGLTEEILDRFCNAIEIAKYESERW